MSEPTVDDIAQELIGTCTFLGTVLERHELEHLENDIEWCGQLDNIAFCCECCDYWFPLSEMAEEGMSHGICFECVEEGE